MKVKQAMRARHVMKLALAAPMAILLAGCVSLGEDPPDSLLTLTSEQVAPAGAAQTSSRGRTILIHEPGVPAEIDVTRLPVRVNDTEVAYLQDALWVEKPARLFRRLVAETVRARTDRLVLDGDDPAFAGGDALRGTLRRFGYDAASSSVVVQFDAIRAGADGQLVSKRFEASETGIPATAGPVGEALNRAANDVARQLADWLAS